MQKKPKLNNVERDEIEILCSKGYSMRAISRALGRGHNTVWYEIKMNGGLSGYKAVNAKLYAGTRLKYRRFQWKKIEENTALKTYIIEKLRSGWNPDEIAGRMKKDKLPFYASKTAIYEWLRSARGQPYCPLLYSRRYRKKPHRKRTERVMIPNRVSIEERGAGAKHRSRYGHWERDTVVSRKGGSGGLSVAQERRSRLIVADKVRSMSPKEQTRARRKTCERYKVLSESFDNGMENREHEVLGISTYFCDPYSSWQKGGVENANKMIRRYFPKGTDFRSVPQEAVDHVVSILNGKPRKILGYRTALEVACAGGVVLTEPRCPN